MKKMKMALTSAMAVSLLMGTVSYAATGAVSGQSVIPAAAASAAAKTPATAKGSFLTAGDLGLQMAETKGLAAVSGLSDTQSGMTVSVSQILYDGTRLAVTLNRNATEMLTHFAGSYKDSKGNIAVEPEGAKGVIKKLEWFINQQTPDGRTESYPVDSVYTAGADNQTVLVRVTDYSNSGLNGQVSLPEKFTIKLKLTVAGIEEPFNISIPVTKIGNSIVLKPAATKTFDGVGVTFNKAELTPFTTRVAISVQGLPGKVSKRFGSGAAALSAIGYDVVDDQGKALKFIGGQGSPELSTSNKSNQDLLFEPFVTTPKFITVKPYLNVFKDGKQTGEYLLDSKGMPVREYIKELEIKVPVKK
ncbi:hypothetical protein J7E73_22995 [Paenibacillus albidus]|uniref:DUF5643 domain-containing protein n=1 Tax=Paenibacillus albidus TaxID=2041023 RepID=UPI001BE9CE5E|nr:DUF5643 domain-containing protein [Paenibacillus albidus]MBT2291943.1 hypothetical protein [Paenibacillus albidus]